MKEMISKGDEKRATGGDVGRGPTGVLPHRLTVIDSPDPQGLLSSGCVGISVSSLCSLVSLCSSNESLTMRGRWQYMQYGHVTSWSPLTASVSAGPHRHRGLRHVHSWGLGHIPSRVSCRLITTCSYNKRVYALRACTSYAYRATVVYKLCTRVVCTLCRARTWLYTPLRTGLK